jgi:hypothetical protein
VCPVYKRCRQKHGGFLEDWQIVSVTHYGVLWHTVLSCLSVCAYFYGLWLTFSFVTEVPRSWQQTAIASCTRATDRVVKVMQRWTGEKKLFSLEENFFSQKKTDHVRDVLFHFKLLPLFSFPNFLHNRHMLGIYFRVRILCQTHHSFNVTFLIPRLSPFLFCCTKIIIVTTFRALVIVRTWLVWMHRSPHDMNQVPVTSHLTSPPCPRYVFTTTVPPRTWMIYRLGESMLGVSSQVLCSQIRMWLPCSPWASRSG